MSNNFKSKSRSNAKALLSHIYWDTPDPIPGILAAVKDPDIQNALTDALFTLRGGAFEEWLATYPLQGRVLRMLKPLVKEAVLKDSLVGEALVAAATKAAEFAVFFSWESFLYARRWQDGLLFRLSEGDYQGAPVTRQGPPEAAEGVHMLGMVGGALNWETEIEVALDGGTVDRTLPPESLEQELFQLMRESAEAFEFDSRFYDLQPAWLEIAKSEYEPIIDRFVCAAEHGEGAVRPDTAVFADGDEGTRSEAEGRPRKTPGDGIGIPAWRPPAHPFDDGPGVLVSLGCPLTPETMDAIRSLPTLAPYLVTKVCGAMQHILLLPASWPRSELVEAAFAQARANRLPTALVLGPEEAVILDPDRGSQQEIALPFSTLVVSNCLRPAREIAPAHELITRQQQLAAVVKVLSGGQSRYVLGDLLKGGRPASPDEISRLAGRGPDGVPHGLVQCPVCGLWRGECLDPQSPIANELLVRVYCACENDNCCARCGERMALAKLNSNRYKADGLIWHYPGFEGFSHKCRDLQP